MAGRETGVVRKRLLGDPDLAIRYIGPARTLLGILKNDMAFNRLDQGLRRATIPIEEVIESGPIRRPSSEAGSTDTGRNDRLLNPQGTSGEEERTERRTRGHVHLYAMSNHGQDEVWIDARAVTVVEKTVKGGLEYSPYLWVGVRAESGGDGWFEDSACVDELSGQMFCLGLGGGDYAYNILLITGKGETLNVPLMLNVWEPLPEGDPIENTIASNRYYYTSPAESDYPLKPPNQMTIGTFDLEYDADDNPVYQYLPDDRVTFTDNNLYCIGGPWAWDPAEEPELWEQVIVLDPEDQEKEWTSTFSYKTITETIPATAVNGPVKWKLKGKVLPGDYLINVSFDGPNCNAYCTENIPGPVNVLVEVRLGQPPGRIMKKRFTFTIAAARSPMRAHVPYGYDGGNPHDINWIPGAIVANVALGTVGYDPDLVPRGLGGGAPLDLTCERGEVTLGSTFAEACAGPGYDQFCVPPLSAVTYDVELRPASPGPGTEERRRKRLWGYTGDACEGNVINMVTNSGYSYASTCDGLPLEWTAWFPNPQSSEFWDAQTGAPPSADAAWPSGYTYINDFRADQCRPCGMGAAEWQGIISSGNWCLV